MILYVVCLACQLLLYTLNLYLVEESRMATFLGKRASHLALHVCCHIFMFRHPEPSVDLLCLFLLSLYLSRLVCGFGF